MADWSFLYGNVASSTEIQKTDINKVVALGKQLCKISLPQIHF